MSIPIYGDRDLYVLTDSARTEIKVGKATDVESRIPKLQTGNPRPLRLLHTIPHAGFLEQFFHSLFAAEVVMAGSEWYPVDSLAAETVRQWRPFPCTDKGSLIQTFGEAVYAAMRVRGTMHSDPWALPESWLDFDVAGFEKVMLREAARRDEHHRRALLIAAHCRVMHDEALDVPQLQATYDIPPIMRGWEELAALLTDRWERRDEIAEHDLEVQEFLRRELEGANG